MTVIAIIILLWSVSALVRRADNKRQQKTIDRINREARERQFEQARLREEWRTRQAEAKAEVARLAAVEREQMRLAKEQERQAEQLAKHEEQIAKLEHRMSVAEGEIDFQMEQIERLREHIEHAEIERDGCVFGSSNYFKWDKKVMTLEKQIHTAEKKISDAQFAKESAQKKLGVA